MATRIGETLPAGQNLFRKPIQRSKLPKAQHNRGGLKRTPLRKQSKKRQAESKIYLVKRKQFLAEHPVCEFPGCFDRSLDVHHMQGRRGSSYLDEKTWMAIDRKHHRFIHDHPNKARELGLLA